MKSLLCFSSQTESREHIVAFNMLNYRSCKNLWKSCVEHHTFFQAKKLLPQEKNVLSQYWTLGSRNAKKWVYALGTVSTLGWEINMSWSPLGSKHPQGEGRLCPGAPALGPELLVGLEPWVKVCWGRSLSFHTRRRFSYSCHLLLPAQLCNTQCPQAASIGTAPSCHAKGSTRLWLRVILVPLRQPLPLNSNSIRRSIITNEQK